MFTQKPVYKHFKMFLVALHIITKWWYDPNDLWWLNGQTNCGTTYTENIAYGTNEETTDMQENLTESSVHYSK